MAVLSFTIGRFDTQEAINETLTIYYMTEDVLSVNISLDSWSNIAFSWDHIAGIDLYVNGYDRTKEANIQRTVSTLSMIHENNTELIGTTVIPIAIILFLVSYFRPL